ncbi:hypothetical protein [Brumimicrobium mesophilum]|uniref:hypothetical protein n=1 Tax=Brumimicrobium mesophilum TaxID=392717 RepID=UPI00131DCDDF|nr:hypothetical protein [Brumimicrobium mesophilum]
MKSKIVLPAFAIMSLSFLTIGQEKLETPIKRITVHDIYISTGTINNRVARGTYDDFKALAPQSDLLNQGEFNFSQSGGYSYNGNSTIAIMLGLKFSDKEKSNYKLNPVLRLGFNYSNGTNLSTGGYKETREPFDTLISSQTGQATYIDSVFTENYGANYSTDQLSIVGSLIFSTDPEARWSLYSGIGIAAGISLNSNTHIYYSTDRYQETLFDNSNGSGYGNSYGSSTETEHETITNKTSFGGMAYIPLGIDFRIANRSEFWKRVHVFYEIKPGLGFTSIPELNTIVNTNFQQGFGLRVTFD